MKCTVLCAECSIILNGQRDGVKSCLPPWIPTDFAGVNGKWLQGDKLAIDLENYFTNKMTQVLPETPSHRRTWMGLSQASNISSLTTPKNYSSREDREGSLLVCFSSKPVTLNEAVSLHVYWNWDMTNPTQAVFMIEKTHSIICGQIHIFIAIYTSWEPTPLHPGRSVWNTPNAGASPHPSSSIHSFEARLGFVLPLATSPWWYLGIPREVSKLKKYLSQWPRSLLSLKQGDPQSSKSNSCICHLGTYDSLVGIKPNKEILPT